MIGYDRVRRICRARRQLEQLTGEGASPPP